MSGFIAEWALPTWVGITTAFAWLMGYLVGRLKAFDDWKNEAWPTRSLVESTYRELKSRRSFYDAMRIESALYDEAGVPELDS